MNNLNAQQHFDQYLTNKQVEQISLKTSGGKLGGELVIQDYPNLQELYLASQELTSLKVINCPQLKRINVRNNQLGKLEVEGENKLVEIIAGQNELTTLNLTNCAKLERLMVPDNPLLSELVGLNLAIIKEINVVNTLVNLGKEFEDLKRERDDLFNVVEGTKTAQEEGELILPAQFITTSEQAEEAIQKHLKKIEKEWREYLAHPENALPVFQLPVWRRKIKKVLIWVVETQTSGDYQGLVDKWNAGKEYNAEDDFDCGSLDKLIQLVKVYNNLKNQNNLAIYE